ncbi:MAG: hypothetical protein ACOH2H_10055 [Cypionkella sp.]
MDLSTSGFCMTCSPVVFAKVLDIDVRKEISLFENFLDRHQIDLHDVLLVEKPDTANRLYREEGPVIAEYLDDPLVLANENHTNDLGLVGHSDPYWNAKLGMPNYLAHVGSFSRLDASFIGGCSIDLRRSMIRFCSSKRPAAMPCPECSTNRPDTATMGGPPEFARISGAAAHPARESIFDPELLDELCNTIGKPRMCLALEDMASTLLRVFVEKSAMESDRTWAFQTADMLTGRAGLMGFAALRDTCAKLQQACATQAPFSEEYGWTRRITLASQEEITSLLKGASRNSTCILRLPVLAIIP